MVDKILFGMFIFLMLCGAIVSIVFIGWLMYSGITTLINANTNNYICSGVFQIVMSSTMIIFGTLLYLKQMGYICKEKENN